MVNNFSGLCPVSSDTNILTGDGFKKAKDLTVEDKLFSPRGKNTSIMSLTFAPVYFGDTFFAITFSNGETIFSPPEQNWRVVVGGEYKNFSSEELHDFLLSENLVLYDTSEKVDSTVSVNIVKEKVCQVDGVASKIFDTHGFSHGVTLIAKAYAVVVDSVVGDEVFLGPSIEVEKKIVDCFGEDVFALVRGGRMPEWFFFLPLSLRLNICAILIDSLNRFSFEQTKSRTYIRFFLNSFFDDDFSRIFGSCGCVEQRDYFFRKDNAKVFCLTYRVKKFSEKLCVFFPSNEHFHSMNTVSVDSVEKIVNDGSIVDGFLFIKTHPKNRGFVVESSTIPIFPS